MVPAPLRVLLMDPHLKGGGQVRYVVNLARYLSEAGHQVWVGCKKGSVLAPLGAEAGATVLEGFHLRNGVHPRLIMEDRGRLKRFVATEHPDVIHVSGSQDHWLAAATNRFGGHPTCLVRSRHNTYPVSAHLPNRVLNRSWTDYQICVCDYVRRDLSASPAFDSDRLCAIHNGVDADLYAPNEEARAAIRLAFGWDRDALVVGIAARLVVDKGHRYLLEGFAQIRDAYPHARLLILGQGPLESELRALSTALGIADRCTFAGFRDDMPRCVQAFDIGVQPSIDCDTSSFSLKEQMAAAKPVIASDFGGLTEIVRDGEEGYVVPAGQSQPIADALSRLLADSGMRAAMGNRGRARVLSEFTLQTFGQRTVDAYRRAIEIHRERAAS